MVDGEREANTGTPRAGGTRFNQSSLPEQFFTQLDPTTARGSETLDTLSTLSVSVGIDAGDEWKDGTD